MVSDVPLGAFLSGGIDSTLLVALMARHAGQRLKTFSVGFAGEGVAIDESDRAERIARELGCEHTRVLVRGEDVRERLPRIAAALDQPSVDGVNSYFVAEAAARSVTVAISGLGGDELFAGYPWWFDSMLNEDEHDRRHPLKTMVKRVVAVAARQPILDHLALNSGAGVLGRCRQFGTYPARFAARNTVFPPPETARLIRRDLWAGAHVGRSFHRDFVQADALPDAPGLERVTGLCLRSYMNDQLLRDVDAVSMAHSLEVRVPFLDPVVTDAALSLPSEAKLRRADRGEWKPGKQVLRDLLSTILPSITPVSVKQGFNMPMADWLRGPVRATMEDVLAPGRVRRRGLLDEEAVTMAKEAFLAGKGPWSGPWVLMMLELWCQEVFDGAA
jgi:asparagine synthase (glutamine-hydrolysing)